MQDHLPTPITEQFNLVEPESAAQKMPAEKSKTPKASPANTQVPKILAPQTLAALSASNTISEISNYLHRDVRAAFLFATTPCKTESHGQMIILGRPELYREKDLAENLKPIILSSRYLSIIESEFIQVLLVCSLGTVAAKERKALLPILFEGHSTYCKLKSGANREKFLAAVFRCSVRTIRAEVAKCNL